MTAALAETEPWWAPARSTVIHAMTFGFLIGEVIRRITGKASDNFCVQSDRTAWSRFLSWRTRS